MSACWEKILSIFSKKEEKIELPLPAVGSHNEQFRDEWVQNALANISAGKRILDAGAGEQQYRKYCTHLNYVSQDFAQYDGQGNGTGLQMGTWDARSVDIVSDICKIPVPDVSFDAVMCTEVLEHLPDPIAALREFSRLLKPNGTLILTAPFISLTHFAPYHFATGFNRYFYEHHLNMLGFSIKCIDANGNYFESMAQELKRLSSIAENYCGLEHSSHVLDLARPLLAELDKLTALDKGSSELLCHGFCVIAVKKA